MTKICFTQNSVQGIITAATAGGRGDGSTSPDGRSSQFEATAFIDPDNRDIAQVEQVLVEFDVSTLGGAALNTEDVAKAPTPAPAPAPAKVPVVEDLPTHPHKSHHKS